MNPPLVSIGYFSKMHGYKGSLKAELDTQLIEAGYYPEFLWIEQMGKPVPFKVIKFAEHEKNTFVVKLEDIDTEEEAHQLKGETIYCEESLYDEYFEDEEGLDYLIGYTLKDPKLGVIGIVNKVIENTFQPNLEIDYKGNEVLIPFADELIIEIDDNKQEILFNLPEGLLDIYL